MDNRQYLLVEGMALELGATRRIVCPWCMGGSSGETSMNLTRTGTGLAYNCHRASCGVHGYVDESGASLTRTPGREGPRGFEPNYRKERVYTGPVLPLTLEDFAYFDQRYELGAVPVEGRIYRSYDGRYILPILWRGKDRGYVLRKPWDGAPIEHPWQGRKSDVYLHDQTAIQQALYTHRGSAHRDTVVIVEDQLSAMKVAEASTSIYGVALLGSLLNVEKVREIQRLRPEEVILALDADATATSFKYAREFGLAFPRMRVAILERDLKDTKLSDIPAVLSL